MLMWSILAALRPVPCAWAWDAELAAVSIARLCTSPRRVSVPLSKRCNRFEMIVSIQLLGVLILRFILPEKEERALPLRRLMYTTLRLGKGLAPAVQDNGGHNEKKITDRTCGSRNHSCRTSYRAGADVQG